MPVFGQGGVVDFALTRLHKLLYKNRMMLIATLMAAMAMCMHSMCMPAAVGALEGSQS